MSDTRRAILWKGLFEVVLIAVGVFLAMEVDQWRTGREHREQARASLERLKAELETNRKAVAAVREYHVELHGRVRAYLDPATRESTAVRMQGIRPVAFEQTAWELAIATQSLADIDSTLAFELARVYGVQRTYTGLTNGMLQAMYLRPPSEHLEPFLHTLRVYLDDIVGLEPELLKTYERIQPLVDRALKD
jgi:hypothetical protein